MDQTHTGIDVQELHKPLRCALRRGARASRLFAHSRHLIDHLMAASTAPEATLSARVIATESIIRTAIAEIGGPEAEALSIIFALRTGDTDHRTLEDRRHEAAHVFGIQADTFRRHHEKPLLWDLAFEICKVLLHTNSSVGACTVNSPPLPG